jgi:serine/threonine protein kinase
LGRVIDGRYLITKPVGFGASGEVYRAESLHIPRQFAVKFIRIPGADQSDHSAEVRERIRRETEAVAGLRNPHVIRIYDLIDLGPRYVAVVMGFIHGRTLLREIDDSEGLPISRIATVGRQISNALFEAHEHDLIHRDVKPENIMLERLPDGGDFSHLLDFGIVWARGSVHVTDGFIGTPLYSSPEQIRAVEVDHRSDIYSLGATLWHAAASRPPFEAATTMAVLRAHMKDEPQKLHNMLPPSEGRDAFAELVHQMLAKHPDARPGDLSEVIERLDEIAALENGWSTPRHTFDDTQAREPKDPPVSNRAALAAPTVALIEPADDNESCGDCSSSSVDHGRPGSDVPCMTTLKLTAQPRQIAIQGSRVALTDPRGAIRWAPLALGALLPTSVELPGDHVTDLALSADATWVASHRRLLRLSDSAEPESVREHVGFVSVSVDTREWLVAAATDRGDVWVRPRFRGETWRRLAVSDPVTAVAVSPDASSLALVHDHGLELRATTSLDTTLAHLKGLNATKVVFSKDGYLVAILTEEGSVVLHSTVDGSQLVSMPTFEGTLLDLAFSADGTLMAVCANGSELYLLDLQCGHAKSCAPGATMCHRIER